MALILALSVYVYLNSLNTNSKPTVIAKSNVIIAATDIPINTKITNEMLTQIQIEGNGVNPDLFFSNIEDLIGKFTKENIYSGEQISKVRIYSDSETSLPLKISGNNRAISIMLSNESGVNKLINPGDRVDILVFLPEIKDMDRIIRPDISILIMQNIEVIGIDKVIAPKIKNESTQETTQDTESTYHMTLSVPVFDVEKLALAEDIGNLKVALRPIEDDYIYPTDGSIWQELLLDEQNMMKDMNPIYEIKQDQVIAAVPGYDKYVYYVVKKGDTLQSLAQEYLGSSDKYPIIQELNNIPDPNMILTGTGIKLPVTE
jgi:pilus assembly protein CpaB